MTNGTGSKVESIAECSHWSILQYVWPALSDNRSWKPILVFLREAVLDRFYCIPKLLYPSIYAEGYLYLVFVFPFVCSFVRSSVDAVLVKVSPVVCVSESVHIWTIVTLRPGGLTFTPLLQTPACLALGGAGQNLGRLYKCYNDGINIRVRVLKYTDVN